MQSNTCAQGWRRASNGYEKWSERSKKNEEGTPNSKKGIWWHVPCGTSTPRSPARTECTDNPPTPGDAPSPRINQMQTMFMQPTNSVQFALALLELLYRNNVCWKMRCSSTKNIALAHRFAHSNTVVQVDTFIQAREWSIGRVYGLFLHSQSCFVPTTTHMHASDWYLPSPPRLHYNRYCTVHR